MGGRRRRVSSRIDADVAIFVCACMWQWILWAPQTSIPTYVRYSWGTYFTLSIFRPSGLLQLTKLSLSVFGVNFVPTIGIVHATNAVFFLFSHAPERMLNVKPLSFNSKQ